MRVECSKEKFRNQTFVVIKEKTISSSRAGIPQVTDIEEVACTDRSFTGQIYVEQDLDACGHMSMSKRYFLNRFVKSSCFNGCKRIPYTIVPSSSNFISSDRKKIVINDDNNLQELFGFDSGIKHVLRKGGLIANKLFEIGFEEFFTFNNKKRSNTTSTEDGDIIPNENLNVSNTATKHVVETSYRGTYKREVKVEAKSLPVVSLGWTTTDCHRYAANYSTVAGSIKPFIFNRNMPKGISLKIMELVELILKSLPRENVFDLSKIKNTEEVNLRKRMMAVLKKHLGGERQDDNVENFRVEGITFLIPASLGYHKDSLNDTTPGMETVVSFNTTIPINETTFPSGDKTKLAVWLKNNGYKKSFPLSMILYSRECIGSYCRRIALHNEFSRRDPVRKCIRWALKDRVGSIVDYRSRIFGDPNFKSIFMRDSKVHVTGRFKSKILVNPACYCKMVSLFTIFF